MDESLELFSYNDYRSFLKDFFKKKKEVKKTYSLRYFSQKAGFSDHSQLTHLVSGRRNVTKKTLNKLIEGLGLDGTSRDYFTYLVNFTQCKTVEEKDQWYKKLNTIRKKSDFYEVNNAQYQYYEEWYYAIIRDLATLDNWNGDFKQLGLLVRPHIVERKVEEAVDILLKIGMLEKKGDKYFKKESVVTPGSIPMFMIHKARNDLSNLGVISSETCSPEERYLLNYGVMVSEGNLEKYYRLLEEFEQKFEALVVDENGTPEKMYQMNVQFFPTTENLIKGDSE